MRELTSRGVVIAARGSNLARLYFTQRFGDDFDKVLSLSLIEEDKTISDEVEAMILKRIEERKEAKANKNFTLADQIRDELFDKGIRLIDSRDGTTYEIM